jgi:acetyltransferase-like isoleucine patch superfamily enzyme
VVVIPGRKIEENARIGAGSVVIHNIKENSSVFGNPAKLI